tara:strand:+ start:23249 stop:23491 length:243 start_codon:yes stop_codon:yes gene_type:complete
MATRKSKKPLVVEAPIDLTDEQLSGLDKAEVDRNERTRVIILEIALTDTELGTFKAGDEYPCTESTADRMIERKLARAAV